MYAKWVYFTTFVLPPMLSLKRALLVQCGVVTIEMYHLCCIATLASLYFHTGFFPALVIIIYTWTPVSSILVCQPKVQLVGLLVDLPTKNLALAKPYNRF